MCYADYTDYLAQYLGTSIREQDFPRLALRASAFLDAYTQGRAARHAGTHALTMACCALAEQYQMIETAQALAQTALTASLQSGGEGELQSQSVGSWSKTYRSAGERAREADASVKTAQAELPAVARQYLAGTGLLYRGRGCGPCSRIR